MDIFKVYICSKASDIDERNYYYQHIIAYYGTNSINTDAFCHTFRCDVHYASNFKNFVIKKMKYLYDKNKHISFYFYSPKLAHLILEEEPQFVKHIPCINSYSLIRQLDDKIIGRSWAKEYIDIVPFKVLPFSECIKNIQNNISYPSIDTFVLQYTVSCGGEGTYIILRDSIDKLRTYTQFFSKDIFLMFSPYYEKHISSTCNFIVYEEDVLVFPIGISKSSLSDGDFARPIYQGTDYSQYNFFPVELKKKVYDSISLLGKKLALVGYRGICGVDFLIYDNNILIMEFNPRYLGSSYLIDMALLDNHLPPLAFFHEEAFIRSTPNPEHIQAIKSLNVPYEGFTFSYNEQFDQQAFNMLLSNLPHSWKIHYDGLDISIPLKHYEQDTYLFRASEKHKDNHLSSCYNPNK